MVRGFRIDGDEESLGGTGEEPINDAVVGRGVLAHKSVFTPVDPFDFELLARRYTIL